MEKLSRKNFIKLFVAGFCLVIASAFFVLAGCNKKQEPEDIKLNAKEKEHLIVGSMFEITLYVSPSNANVENILISNSNPSILKLGELENVSNAEFKISVTSLKVGTATITFRIEGTYLQAATTFVVSPEPEKLQTPTGVKYNEELSIIEWNAVENSTGYVVNLNGEEHEVTGTTFGGAEGEEILKDEFINAKVKAKANGISFSSSEYSENITFYHLTTVKNLKHVEGVVMWDDMPLASAYIVNVNGMEHKVFNAKFNLNDALRANSYSVKVKPIAFEEKGGVGGTYSNEINVGVLSAPAGIETVNNNKVNGKVTGSLLKWQKVDNAIKYVVNIVGSGYNKTIETKLTEIQLIDEETGLPLEYGEYSATIYAVANGTEFLNSKPSENFKFKIISSVSSAEIYNNLLTVNSILEAKQYEFTFVNENTKEEIVVVTNGNSINLTQVSGLVGKNKVSVRTIAENREGVNYGNGESVNLNLEFEILSVVNVERVENDGTIYFEKLDAENLVYEIYFNNEKVGETKENFYKLGKVNVGESSVYVKPVGNGVNYIENIVNIEEFKIKKLETPSNFELNSMNITWGNNANAFEYSVGLNGEQLAAQKQNSYNLNNKNVFEINTLSVQACGNNYNILSSNIETYEFSKLGVVENVRVENGELTWDAISGATYEILLSNGKKIVVSSNKYAFSELEAGFSGNVRIMAMKSGFANSDNTESFEITKILTPTNLNVRKLKDTYVASWSAVENAKAYEIIIFNANGEEGVYLSETNTFAINSKIQEGEHFVKVRALAASGNVINGDESGSYKFSKLKVVENIFVEQNAKGESVINWQSVTDASGYELLFITTSAPNGFTIKTATNEFVIPEYGMLNFENFNDAGTWSVQIYALGNETNVITSEVSNLKTIVKLNETNTLKVVNGEIKFNDDYLNLAENLELNKNVKINVFVNGNKVNNAKIIKDGSKLKVTELNLEEAANSSVEVSVSINGFISSNLSNTIIVNKLASAKNFRVENEMFKWNAVANANEYVITNLETSNTVVVSGNVQEQSISVFNLNKSGVYTFSITALGTSMNSVGEVGYLTSAESSLYAVHKLAEITTSKIENGAFVWELNPLNADLDYTVELKIEADNGTQYVKVLSLSEQMMFDFTKEIENALLGAGVYNITLTNLGNNKQILTSNAHIHANVEKLIAPESVRVENGKLVWQLSELQAQVGQFEVTIGNETLFVNSYENQILINKILDTEAKQIKVRYVANGYVSSDYSNTALVRKLNSIHSLRAENNALVWNAYESGMSNSYIVEASAPVFNGSTTFEVVGGQTSTLNLEQFNLEQGEYTFTILGVGNTNNVSEQNSVGYISSEESNAVNIKVLNSTTSVGTNEGTVVWNKVEDAFSYEIKFYEAVNVNGKYEKGALKEVRSTNSTYYDMQGIPEANYVVKVVAKGNKQQIFDGTENNENFVVSNINFIKDGNLSVQNGVITWEINSLDVAFALGLEQITDADVDLINGILNNTLTDETAKLKLKHILNYDALVNGAKHRLMPESVMFNSTKSTLIFTSSFKFASGNYTLALRTTANNVDSVNLENEDLIRYVYGAYTKELSFVKLPAPISPASENSTAIINNEIVWQKTVVAGNTELNVNYMIVAVPTSMGNSTITNVIDWNTNYSSVNKQYSVKIRNLANKLKDNVLYNIYVIACGTLNSDDNLSSEIYVNSEYATTSPVVLLNTPQVFMENGIIKWEGNANALGYNLTIADAKNEHTNINLNLDSTITEFDMSNYSTVIPEGNYKVSVKAIGDGVTIISTDEINIREVIKVNNVSTVDVEKGNFTFSLVNNTTNYELTVVAYNQNGEQLLKYEPVVKSFLYSENGKGTYALPDECKSLDAAGNPIKYVLEVKPMGTITKTSTGTLMHNGDVTKSNKFERLNEVGNVRAENGKITWNSVTNAHSYVIKVGDREEALGNNNVYTLLEPAGSAYSVSVKAMFEQNSYLNAAYSAQTLFRIIESPKLSTIRGVVGWSDNVSQVTPCSRIEVKVVSYTDATYSTIKNDYNIINLASETKQLNLESTKEVSYPSGYYRVSVTFVGSDELVEVPNGQSYYYLSSQTSSIKFNKLESPQIKEDFEEKENGEIESFVYWNRIANAVGYNVKIVSLTNTANEINLNTETDATTFEDVFGGSGISLSINKISEIASKAGMQMNEYNIYVNAYGINQNAEVQQTIYTLSDYSEPLAMVLPMPPTNLKLNAYGEVSWVNESATTKPVLYVTYTNAANEKVEETHILSEGTTSFKLSYIASDYTIRIRSVRNDKIYSEFSKEVITNAKFNLFASGAGTANNPYIIKTENELRNVNYYLNSVFKLNNNITLTGSTDNWQIISQVEEGFRFNGNQKTISNLVFKGRANSVGFVENNYGLIENLKLEYVVNGALSNVFGGVAVNNYGTINNCQVSGYNNEQAVFNYSNNVSAGGIANYNAATGKILNSVNKLEFNGQISTNRYNTSFGGVVERNDGVIDNCGNIANISGLQIAGVAVINSNKITNSFFKGTLTSNNALKADMVIGGIVGINTENVGTTGGTIVSYGVVENCYVIANINAQNVNGSSTNVFVGGIMARQNVSRANNPTVIKNSYVVIENFQVSNIGYLSFKHGYAVGNTALTTANIFENVNVVTDDTNAKLVGNIDNSMLGNSIKVVTKLNAKTTNFATSLGSAFKFVSENYPILAWEENYEI